LLSGQQYPETDSLPPVSSSFYWLFCFLHSFFLPAFLKMFYPQSLKRRLGGEIIKKRK
jgi:hypothetical protein